jgi:hypothetical protein
LSEWLSLDSVPKDGTEALFWVPDDDDGPIETGRVVLGHYDAAIDGYFASNFDRLTDEILPVCWRRVPRGPSGTEEISFRPEE